MGPWCDLGHVVGNVQEHGYGAQGLGKAAWPRGLLTHHPKLKGYLFILDPAGQPPYSNLGDDIVGPFQRFLPLRRKPEFDVGLGCPQHASRQSAHNAQSVFINVHQSDGRHRQLILCLDETFDELWGIGAASADDTDL